MRRSYVSCAPHETNYHPCTKYEGTQCFYFVHERGRGTPWPLVPGSFPDLRSFPWGGGFLSFWFQIPSLISGLFLGAGGSSVSGSRSFAGWDGIPLSWSRGRGGVLRSGPRTGYPLTPPPPPPCGHQDQDILYGERGVPQSGPRTGYCPPPKPGPGQGRGILQSGPRTGYPPLPPPSHNMTWTGYAAGSTPLAVTQEVFLVLNRYFVCVAPGGGGGDLLLVTTGPQ